ncbi:hypothetical protein [Pontibacter sp. HSC-36F09]|uniref:WapI family immunity protein n=1 Tax=Pontibacter sp. HSC-36F09 TaxID=2910966 RepID=UPI00209FDE85|nr:hypothetical protein [Pontibacter sp. HSC-36F09]MCP2043399.1 hypothetical protein [Pontibacter sp. HSC-36F09]
MEEFSIKGDNGNHLKISFQEVYGFPESTCNWGGYEVRSSIEIKSNNFMVKSTLWTSTGELHDFFKRLEACNKEIKGTANFTNYESNLEFVVTYDELGHVNIKGKFEEFTENDNELKFEFNSDQSYLSLTLEELRQIVKKYGNMRGVER